MKRSAKITISSIAAVVLALGCLGFATADTLEPSFTSSGIIEVNSDGKTAVFDTNDINLIYNEVKTGRNELASTINSLGYHSLGEEFNTTGTAFALDPASVRFTDLINAADDQFTIPDSYVGQTVNGTDAAGNADQSEPSKIAVSDNIALGAMAWNNNGELLYGSGKDNMDWYTRGYNAGQSTTVNPGYQGIYHHHTLGTIGDSDSISNVAGSYGNGYIAPTSGGCFTTPKKHKHTGDQDHYGGCYTKPTQLSGGWVSSVHWDNDEWVCSLCDAGLGTDENNPPSGHYCSYGHHDGYALNCGKTANSIEGYTRSCGCTECQLVGYKKVY